MRGSRVLRALTGVVMACAVVAPVAQAGDLSFGLSIGVPAVIAPQPVYVTPPPQYAPPPVYYVQPAYMPGYYAGPGYYYPVRRYGPRPGYGYRQWRRYPHFHE